MKRRELEHLAWVAGGINETWEVLVLNAPALLAVYPDAPDSLVGDRIAEIATRQPCAAPQILTDSLGPDSAFYRHHGYGAVCVSLASRSLPQNWASRLRFIRSQRTGPTAAGCLDIHDLAVSLYLQGRPKDLDFVVALANERLLNRVVFLDRLAVTPGFTDLDDAALNRHADLAMGDEVAEADPVRG